MESKYLPTNYLLIVEGKVVGQWRDPVTYLHREVKDSSRRFGASGDSCPGAARGLQHHLPVADGKGNLDPTVRRTNTESHSQSHQPLFSGSVKVKEKKVEGTV